MKKHFVTFICILCIAALCLSLSACSRHTLKINAEDVEKVTLYRGEFNIEYLDGKKDGIELTSQDLEKFIRLYNDAGYCGTELNYGTTSQWGCAITLKDGNILKLTALCDADFWVGHYRNGTYVGGDYYIQSNELDAFLTTILTDNQ